MMKMGRKARRVTLFAANGIGEAANGRGATVRPRHSPIDSAAGAGSPATPSNRINALIAPFAGYSPSPNRSLTDTRQPILMELRHFSEQSTDIHHLDRFVCG
jgi:hypothetical protein